MSATRIAMFLGFVVFILVLHWVELSLLRRRERRFARELELLRLHAISTLPRKELAELPDEFLAQCISYHKER